MVHMTHIMFLHLDIYSKLFATDYTLQGRSNGCTLMHMLIIDLVLARRAIIFLFI